jgi:energy-converting hydrogenase Eha subunit E
MGGRVEAAVAAVEAPGVNATVRVTLLTGRAVAIQAPVDLTANEALQLITFIATQLGAELAKGRPRSPILVPRR